MNNYKYRTQLYLDEDHYRFLKEQSARYQISMAEVVRRLLDRELEKNEEIKDDDPIFQMGREGTATGRVNGSLNHDRYIYGQFPKHRSG
ncbi:MAG: hypothetical protein IMW93_08855 [Thermoanaerobacteraceae bacterium]|nr:hypothetical protein [Thermoanaerobacteraceae bacterium]